MKLRCMIVDDEPLALDILTSYINKIDNLELVASLSNAVEAFNMLTRSQVDILFLDIQMPRLNGLDLIRNMNKAPKVIFTTAYREYALEGYELDAADYLLKPISFDRFLRAVQKVIHSYPQPAQALASNGNPPYSDAFIYLKADKKMVKVFLNEILYIESLKDYIRVFTPEKNIVTYQRISYMEEKLPHHKFIRIHRSYIVALDKVEAYSNSHVEVAKKEIPIGRNYRQGVLKMLNKDNLLEG